MSDKYKKKRRGKRKIQILGLLLLMTTLGGCAVFPAGGKSQTAEEDGTAVVEASADQTVEKWQEGDISYNGQTYRYNTRIKTYLFLGIDKKGTVEKEDDQLLGGQSDAMFLLVENPDQKKLSVIAIQRNTMADIETYDSDGNYTGMKTQQICLAHGYGDGMYLSCQRSADAVSKLFYNIPINGYFAMNMEGIAEMNDALGGVTVTPEEDIHVGDTVLKAGETVILDGEQAYVYLRYRDVNEDDSATARMHRQMEYLTNLFEKLKGDDFANVLLAAYQKTESYIVTNVDFASLITEIKDYTADTAGIYEIPGEVYYGKFEEYHADDTALYELILDIFYDKAQ